MARVLTYISLIIILTFTFSGCQQAAQSIELAQNEGFPTYTTISPTSTPLPGSTPSLTSTPHIPSEPSPSPALTLTSTATPRNTLEPETANETIKTLLREPVDCSAPCFWGITPGETTAEEAKNIFSHLGLQTKIITYQGKDYYNVDHNLDEKLSFGVNLPISNNIVESIFIQLVPNDQIAGSIQEWTVYSPQAMIERYGQPSRVDFGADWGPGPFFEMDMYFDSQDLIIEYAGDAIIPSQKGASRVCPTTAPFNSVRLWMGKVAPNSPAPGIPLEEATSLTLEEFSKLMTGDPNGACFIFNGNVF